MTGASRLPVEIWGSSLLEKSPPNVGLQPGVIQSIAGASSLAVLIVGMHRSGTSALGGMLNKLGVAVPEDLHPADEHNTRGYFEPQRIIAFHERLLAKLGSPSNDPLPLTYDWLRSPLGEAAAEELAEILDEEFAANPMCLFKDPRICRLMPVWSAALMKSGRAAAAILPYRDPLEVAGSLAAKAGLGRPYSLFMWLQHVILGERFTRETPRSFSAYDDLMADWRAVSAKLQRDLGLTWPKDVMRAGPEVDAFLSAELRHHQSRSEALDPAEPLDALCQRVWEGLLRFEADPYDSAAMAAFDAVWADFETAFGVFGPLVIDYQHRDAELSALKHLQAQAIHDQAEFHATALERIKELESVVRWRDRELRDVSRTTQRIQNEVEAALKQSQAAAEQAHQDAQRIWRDAERAEQESLRLRQELQRVHSAARRDAYSAQAYAQQLEGRLHQIESSTFWAISHPLRRALVKYPSLRLAGRRALKLAWWTATFRLGRKLRERALATTALSSGAASAPLETVGPELDLGPAPTFSQPSPATLEPLRGPGSEPPPGSEPAAYSGAAANAPRSMPLPSVRADLPAIEKAFNGHVLFVSGEPATPGHRYRIVRWAEAAQRAGATTTVIAADEIPQYLHEVRFADFVFLWRVGLDERVESLVNIAREAGTPVVFDTDDLMFDPELAKAQYIDGIRSQGFDEEEVAAFFSRVREVLVRADYCTAPTPFLVQRMRLFDKPGFVLPNGFDEEVLQRSRLAARRRRQTPPDGLVRIGYATGTRTHQKDFAQCVEAVADVLRAHPQARLVAFIHGEDPVLDLAEFPAMAGLEQQVEWRQLVPLDQLPDELARFDICIAPLEVGNPFCEAKSELKFFEAALVDVPTVASPTEPFRRAIREGETGFLAADLDGWRKALTRLIEEPELRRAIAQAALYEALADYGPERRVEAFLSVMEQVMLSPRRAGRAFELELLRRARPRAKPPFVAAHEIVFERDRLRPSAVTVVIPLHNYAGYIVEALESVRNQTVGDVDLIVVNDASTDNSEAVAQEWLEAHAERFNRVLLIRNLNNAGLGFTRNVAFANAETPYVLPLDADNRLRPHCIQQTLHAIERSAAAFAYPRIRHFGESDAEIGKQSWSAARFTNGNYVDAMALVRRSAWAEAGGYDHVRYGWEDFDFWCRLVERGMFGVQVPEYVADYRVHGASMLRTETELVRNKLRLIEDIERRHSWLRIERPRLPDGATATTAAAEAMSQPADGVTAEAQRLDKILPLLRCPESGGQLVRDGETLRVLGCDKHWPIVRGRPVLCPGLDEPRIAEAYDSHKLPPRVIELIERTEGFVLNLSAGNSPKRYEHVVEAEFAIFRHTDVVADAHALPFADDSFELVISMNAFEHYRSPEKAAEEIRRVLKPGGQVLIHTAFLQPLHEAPWHFFNATRYGVEKWFERFETLNLKVSDNFNPMNALSWLASEAEQVLRSEVSGEEADRLASTTAKDLIAMWRDPAQRDTPLWRNILQAPQPALERIAAGFEYLGRKPS
ncbi:MAG: adhesin [Phenylobacterium sp.]|nr:adhesin [Phenylobacterium sp.]